MRHKAVATAAAAAGGGGVTLVGFANGGTTSSSVNVTLPGGSAEGDLCLIAELGTWCAYTPSGCTTTIALTTDSSTQFALFEKALTATDISNGYVTCPGETTYSTQLDYLVYVFEAGASTDQTATQGAGFAEVSPQTVNVSSVTTTADNDICVVFCVSASTNTGSGFPGGWTVDRNNGTTSPMEIGAHFTKTTAGATGAETFSLSPNDYARWVSAIVSVTA